MAVFNIQTINNEIKHDFTFHLAEAVNYQNWITNEITHEIIRSEQPGSDPKTIPIGDLEFVFSHLSTHYGILPEDIRPINIPLVLMHPEFVKRKCRILQKTALLQEEGPLFIKSQSAYKSVVDVMDNFRSLPDGYYLVSEEIEIDSEWRCFVGPEGLLGLQHYLGDCTLFPDVEVIKKMIDRYANSSRKFPSPPRYYSLDVGINESGTFVIEVHPIVSCGLYGFNNPRILPQMMINGYQYMRDQALQQKNKRDQAI